MVAKIATLPAGHGYNAATGEYGDLVAQGVIDPVKVTRSAVQNAASIAGMLLTTETLVVEKPEEQEAARGQRPRAQPPALRLARPPGRTRPGDESRVPAHWTPAFMLFRACYPGQAAGRSGHAGPGSHRMGTSPLPLPVKVP